MTRRLLATAMGATFACLAAAPDARATDAEAQAAAESLFMAARKLVVDGRYAEACPKFAESQRLDPAAGTLLNLADCYERAGRTASAWVTFSDAAKAAVDRNRADWRATALERARALEPRLVRLVVVVPATSAISGLAVARDGRLVGAAEWSVDIPVDPGEHVVTARAPGRVDWTSTTPVDAAHPRVVVTVPELAVASAAGRTAAAPSHDTIVQSPNSRGSNAVRTLGWVSVAAGAAGVAVGIVAGVVALTKKSDADRECPASPCANADGLSANDAAHQAARVSTIGFIAGLALAAGGVTILALSPSKPSASSASASKTSARAAIFVVPAAGPTGASLDVAGRF